MLDIHKELRELCERQGEAIKQLTRERDDARAQRDAAIETAAHIGKERDALKAAALKAEIALDSLTDKPMLSGNTYHDVVFPALEALHKALGGDQ